MRAEIRMDKALIELFKVRKFIQYRVKFPDKAAVPEPFVKTLFTLDFRGSNAIALQAVELPCRLSDPVFILRSLLHLPSFDIFHQEKPVSLRADMVFPCPGGINPRGKAFFVSQEQVCPDIALHGAFRDIMRIPF